MPNFFTPEELAKRWRTKRHAIDGMIKRKELPHFRVGKLIRITEEAVREIESCQNSSSSGTEKNGPQHGPKAGKPDAPRFEPIVVTPLNSA